MLNKRGDAFVVEESVLDEDVAGRGALKLVLLCFFLNVGGWCG